MLELKDMIADKKHPAFIIAVEAAFIKRNFRPVNGLFHTDYDMWTIMAQSYVTIREREQLEKDKNYLQLLPYIALLQPQENPRDPVKFFVYQRTKKIGEDRLAKKVSVGIGGHPDAADLLYFPPDKANGAPTSVINLQGSLRKAAKRETDEELVFEVVNPAEGQAGDMVDPKPSDIIFHRSIHEPALTTFIHDTSDDVGQHHLGIVIERTVSANYKFSCKEEELITLPPMTAEELLASGLDLENWSRLYLEEVVRRNVYNGNSVADALFRAAKGALLEVSQIDFVAGNTDDENNGSYIRNIGYQVKHLVPTLKGIVAALPKAETEDRSTDADGLAFRDAFRIAYKALLITERRLKGVYLETLEAATQTQGDAVAAINNWLIRSAPEV